VLVLILSVRSRWREHGMCADYPIQVVATLCEVHHVADEVLDMRR
jgi:hypothetical protein